MRVRKRHAKSGIDCQHDDLQRRARPTELPGRRKAHLISRPRRCASRKPDGHTAKDRLATPLHCKFRKVPLEQVQYLEQYVGEIDMLVLIPLNGYPTCRIAKK